MENKPGRRRARCLLTSYYGAEAGVALADDMNVDVSGFNANRYVASLLQYKSLEELVQRGNSMVSEIKSLDSDMQMLVYENYNKFISATDTIRAMKHRVQVFCSCSAPLPFPRPVTPFYAVLFFCNLLAPFQLHDLVRYISALIPVGLTSFCRRIWRAKCPS